MLVFPMGSERHRRLAPKACLHGGNRPSTVSSATKSYIVIASVEGAWPAWMPSSPIGRGFVKV